MIAEFSYSSYLETHISQILFESLLLIIKFHGVVLNMAGGTLA